MEENAQEQLYQNVVIGEVMFTYRILSLEEVEPYKNEKQKNFYLKICTMANVKPNNINFKNVKIDVLQYYAEKILKSSKIYVIEENGEKILSQEQRKKFDKRKIWVYLGVQIFVIFFVFTVSFLLAWIKTLL